MVAAPAETPGHGVSGRVSKTFPFSMGTAAIGTLLLVVATVFLYWPSVAWMADEWSSGNALFSHGYLIAAIAVFLIIRSVIRMPETELTWQGSGLVFVLVVSFVWLLGTLSNVAAAHSSVVPFIALAAIYAAFGMRVARHMAFPVLFICFALPAWQYLQPPFRDFAIVLIDVTVQAIGIPVQVDGNIVHLPEGSFRIINGCSGINFIVVGLALSSLYGHLYYKKLKPRAILIATAVVLAMITNWVRVVSLALIGNASKMQSELVYDHLNYGWLLFTVALIPLFLIARRLEGIDEGGEAVPADLPVKPTNKNSVTAILVVVFALAMAPVWAGMATGKYDSAVTAIIILPDANDPWSGPETDASVWFPKFIGPTAEAIGRYDSRLGTVWFYQNVYLEQTQDRELIYMFNDVGGDLRSGPTSRATVIDSNGNPFTLNTRIASRGYNKWLIGYWYTVGDGIEVSELRAKASQAIATLRGLPEAGLTALAVLCEGTCQGAETALADFIKSGTPLQPIDYDVESRRDRP